MKLVITSIYLCLFTMYSYVSANLDRELRESIDAAMKCRFREPPKGPVLAVSPARFVQVVVILHERFDTPACFRHSRDPISVLHENTWPFCIFGKCNQGRCQCAGNFVGPKCSIYSKKCWLMYCYLTSCHPSHQSLHCVCDPSLYGTKIITGIYWYDEGKSSKFMPPPPGWHDEPSGMIKLKSDPSISMGQRNQYASGTRQNQHASGSLVQNSARGSKAQILPGMNSNRGFQPSSRTDQKMVLYNRNMGGRKPGFGSRVRGESAARNMDKDENTDKKKTDVEEALDELEELSPARKINAFNINLLLLIALWAQWLRRIRIV